MGALVGIVQLVRKDDTLIPLPLFVPPGLPPPILPSILPSLLPVSAGPPLLPDGERNAPINDNTNWLEKPGIVDHGTLDDMVQILIDSTFSE